MHSGDRVQDLLHRSLEYINGETQLDRWQFSAFLKTLANRRNTDLEADFESTSFEQRVLYSMKLTLLKIVTSLIT